MAHAWGPHVRLETTGRGQLEGQDRDATLRWSAGTVRVEVEPHTQTRFAVTTEEALVQVVGTVFQVRRDVLGSTVGVDRGEVDVRCADGSAHRLTAGEAHTCPPVTAAGLLGRADALQDVGSRDAVAQSLDRGIALTEGPILGELLARRMRLHAAEGRIDAALSDAHAYLDADSGRALEVQRFAGWLALEQRGCAAAVPWLESLHAAAPGVDSVLLAECVAPTDAERARATLDAASPHLDAEWSQRAARLEPLLGGTP